MTRLSEKAMGTFIQAGACIKQNTCMVVNLNPCTDMDSNLQAYKFTIQFIHRVKIFRARAADMGALHIHEFECTCIQVHNQVY